MLFRSLQQISNFLSDESVMHAECICAHSLRERKHATLITPNIINVPNPQFAEAVCSNRLLQGQGRIKNSTPINAFLLQRTGGGRKQWCLVDVRENLLPIPNKGSGKGATEYTALKFPQYHLPMIRCPFAICRGTQCRTHSSSHTCPRLILSKNGSIT